MRRVPASSLWEAKLLKLLLLFSKKYMLFGSEDGLTLSLGACCSGIFCWKRREQIKPYRRTAPLVVGVVINCQECGATAVLLINVFRGVGIHLPLAACPN